MKIGVTGSSGLIGRAWLECGSHKPGSVRFCIARKIPAWAEETVGTHWMQGDLSDQATCRTFIKDLDVLIHLAGASSPLTTGPTLAADLCANLIPTLNLIQAARERGKSLHIIFASSGGQIYGRGEPRSPWREVDECRPVSAYGAHKLTAEHYLRILGDEGSISCTILRIGNVYGEALPPDRMQGFIGTAIHELQHQRPVRLIGDSANIRDYVHLDDICSALDWACGRTGLGVEIFNVGTGRGQSVDQLLSLLQQNWPTPFSLTRPPFHANSRSLIPWNVLDPQKSAAAGWSAKINIEEGLIRMIHESQARA